MGRILQEIFDFSKSTFDNGKDRVFRNVGQQKLDTGEIPKRI
jgi:hypothetical protein